MDIAMYTSLQWLDKHICQFCRFSITFYDNSCIKFSSPEGIRYINDVLILYPLLASNDNGLINDLILL